jgi:NADPH:quinone reductase-like Zn-dependent oxidoreductase
VERPGVTDTVDAVVLEVPGRSPSVLRRERPRPGTGEVGVRVTAAPIVPLDLLCASGTSYFGVPATPYVPGVQGVGVVERGTPTVPAGTAVWFATSAGMAPGDGSMRGVAIAPEHDIVPIPESADPALVAALGLSGVAAWMSLTWRGELAGGEQVLVLGAGGVVGQAAVQLARVAGARRVIAAARSAAARDRARRAAPDALVEIEDGDDPETLAARIRTACDGPLDLVVDPLFGIPAAAALRALRPHGRLVNFGSSAGEVAPIDSSTLRSRSLRVLGYTNNELTPEQRRDALTRVVAEAVAGRLGVAHEVVPLSAASDAWSRQAAGQVDGRIVLVPEEDE